MSHMSNTSSVWKQSAQRAASVTASDNNLLLLCTVYTRSQKMSVRTVLLVLMVLMVVQAAVSMPVSSIEGRQASSCDHSGCTKLCQAQYAQQPVALQCGHDMCWFSQSELSAASKRHVALRIAISSIQGRGAPPCTQSQCQEWCDSRYVQSSDSLICGNGLCWFYPKKLLSAV